MTRKRRVQVAALMVTGILCVCGFVTANNSQGFFDYIETRSLARNVSRFVFTMVGMKRDFDAKVYWAKNRRLNTNPPAP
jgi:hypothetical protein